jgi:hypothetical protein
MPERLVGRENMRILAILAAALLLAACSNSPESVAAKFSAAGANGHTAEATELLDPQVKETFGPKLPFAIAEAQRKANARGGVKSADAEKLSENGDYATVRVTTHYNDGSSGTENARLRRVRGKWYISM